MYQRARALLGGVAAAGIAVGSVVSAAAMRAPTRPARPASAARALPPVDVYKDPACGCCRAWVERMRAAGFTVTVHDVASEEARDAFKRKQGVTPSLAACHTATVGGYVVEGHVPPELVIKMLSEHPKVAGLAVPGMPAGSPGMEGMGSDHYDVVTFTSDGATKVYARR